MGGGWALCDVLHSRTWGSPHRPAMLPRATRRRRDSGVVTESRAGGGPSAVGMMSTPSQFSRLSTWCRMAIWAFTATAACGGHGEAEAGSETSITKHYV